MRFDPAAEAAMRELIGGSLRTQAIYVAASLAVADQLSLGPRTAEDIAARVGAHAPSLKRILRFLSSRGVFRELPGGSFSLMAMGELLQTAHPRSLKASAVRAGEEMWAVSARLMDAVRGGPTPHDAEYGTGFFDRMTDRGIDGHFAARMATGAAEVAAALSTLACVERATTIVDVGGGLGHILAGVLSAKPHLRGVLFDRTPLIQSARTQIETAGLADRCQCVAGDMFSEIPAGGDVYVLSWVLHDWHDGAAVQILRACRRAGSPHATVIIVEILLPECGEALARIPAGLDPFVLDLQMLLLTGGRERTAGEFQRLLLDAGYATSAVTPLLAGIRGAGLIEAAAASL
jgi:hypothetical protein